MFGSVEDLSPSRKGAIAEAELTSAALRLGVTVLRPIAEGARYDLAFDIGNRVLRIQCKWASRRGDVVTAFLRTSRHTPTNGYVHTTYSKAEVDACGLYCADLHRCFLIPIEDVAGATHVHLRLVLARNNQRRGVRMANAYDLAKMIRDLGAIAQLGERRAGSAKVAGSSPASSTAEGPRSARPFVVAGTPVGRDV